jgi:hypothetical protein
MEELHYVSLFIVLMINVDFENPQIMCCILCHDNPINATNPRIQFRRGLMSYYKTNGIKF